MTLKPMQIGLITGFGGLALLGLVVYRMKQHAPGYLDNKAASKAARDIISKHNEAYEGSNPNETYTKRLRKFKPRMNAINENDLSSGGSRKFRKKKVRL